MKITFVLSSLGFRGGHRVIYEYANRLHRSLANFLYIIARYVCFSYQYTIRKHLRGSCCASMEVGQKTIEPIHSILDLGCADGEGWRLFIQPKDGSLYTIGADICLESLKRCKEKELYKDLVCCDVKKLPFRSESFDTVLLLQCIEHVAKQDGLKVIEEIERVACKQVIMTTPVGFLHIEDHISGWEVEEFQKLGYHVSGHGVRIPMPRNRKLRWLVFEISCFTSFSPSLLTGSLNLHFKW